MGVEGSLGSSAPPVARFRGAIASSHARSRRSSPWGCSSSGFLLRLYLTRRIPAPWIMGDELLYSDLARNVADTGHLAIRGLALSVRTYGIYPVVVAPAWLADSTTTAYGLAKTINALLMTLAAVPVYLWARRIVRPELALSLLGLVLLLPAMTLLRDAHDGERGVPGSVPRTVHDRARARATDASAGSFSPWSRSSRGGLSDFRTSSSSRSSRSRSRVKLFLDWRAPETLRPERELRSYLPTLGRPRRARPRVRRLPGRARATALQRPRRVSRWSPNAHYSLRAVARWVVLPRRGARASPSR